MSDIVEFVFRFLTVDSEHYGLLLVLLSIGLCAFALYVVLVAIKTLPSKRNDP